MKSAPFHVCQLSLAAMVLLCVSLAAAAWESRDGAASRTMTASEAHAVVGGDTQDPETKLCLGSPLGQGCNKPDTECVVGNQYCAEVEQPLLCADRKRYRDPTRCNAADTDLYCVDDDEELSKQMVVCYSRFPCECFDDIVANAWVCRQKSVGTLEEVPGCVLLQSPPR